MSCELNGDEWAQIYRNYPLNERGSPANPDQYYGSVEGDGAKRYFYTVLMRKKK